VAYHRLFKFFSDASQSRKSELIFNSQIAVSRLMVWLSAFALIAAGFIRYLHQPSFWLDEAFVAVSLKNPSLQTIFAQLEYGQYFPRIYFSAIAALREIFGYRIWSIRLLPFLSFVIATVLWAQLLLKRAASVFIAGLLSTAFLLGANYWLDQSIQLKQYTLDVLLALIPFLLSDEVYKETLAEGKRKWILVVLAIPCALSYTYPMSVGARLAGWYLDYGRKQSWRIRPSAIVIFVGAMALALSSIYVTDHRFNFQDRAAYYSYWSDCILGARLQEGMGSALRLLAKFLWGWHGRMPMVTALMAPLQIIGVYWIIRRWRNPAVEEENALWGSRSCGSLILLAGVVTASLLVNYPICAGRVTLFTQVHTQILALEGALFLWAFLKRGKVKAILFSIIAGVLLFHSGREYVRFCRAESAENLHPILPLIDRAVADKVWVHPCSVAQVRALPEPLPVTDVMLTGKLPKRAGKVWILWSHLGNETCQQELAEIKERASSWQIIHEGSGRGLALAEF
jgi:hypothetical protein